MGTEEQDAVFRMITYGGARTLHIEDSYGISVGRPADLVVLDAPDGRDAIRRQAVARFVVSRGRIVSQTLPAHTSVNLGDGDREVDFRMPQAGNPREE